MTLSLFFKSCTAAVSLAGSFAVGSSTALAGEESAPARSGGGAVGDAGTPVVSTHVRTPGLPPLPAGVEDLKFTEIFKMPIGPRGLEPTERLRALDGKKVRLTGMFVFEDWSACSCPPDGSPPPAQPNAGNGAPARRSAPSWMKHVVPGRIMLSPVATSVSLGHYGLADELPPQVAFLEMAHFFGEPVFYKPGMFAVTGTLNIGQKKELDGRTSFIRVKVEKDADVVLVAGAPGGTRPATQVSPIPPGGKAGLQSATSIPATPSASPPPSSP